MAEKFSQAPKLGSMPKSRSRWLVVFFIFLGLMGCSRPGKPWLPSLKLPRGSDRIVIFTDKQQTYWATVAGRDSLSPWLGMRTGDTQMFQQIRLTVGDKKLKPAAAEVTVTPFELQRYYPEFQVTTQWTLLDTMATLALHVHNGKRLCELRIIPPISGTVDSSPIRISEHAWFIPPTTSDALGLYLWSSGDLGVLDSGWTFRADSAGVYTDLYFTFTAMAQAPADNVFDLLKLRSALLQRRDRISRLLSDLQLRMNDSRSESAILWAEAGMDQLIMNRMGPGIYAGLPWFNDYWARDTFISFPGALLVTGRFALARQILLTMAQLQNTVPNSPTYGRLPNRVRPGEKIYNSVDGTLWFIRALWQYFQYTGDKKTVFVLWPTVKRALEGGLSRTDDYEMLLHGPAETWMDAVGTDGPWSPRGNRAVEVQFLWRDGLVIGQHLAELKGDEGFKHRLIEAHNRLQVGLAKLRRTDVPVWGDHLGPGGELNTQVRPNLLLAPSLFSPLIAFSDLKYCGASLITHHGVLSLEQKDTRFHPYHLHNAYPKDAAYHNGVVWVWNSGPVISTAVRFHQFHFADTLFTFLSDELLDRGAVGALPELLDAWPDEEGNFPERGTFTQAWSLAEYLRVFYQDLLGVRPDWTLTESDYPQLTLAPHLLPLWERVEFAVRLGDEEAHLFYEEREEEFKVRLERNSARPWILKLSYPLPYMNARTTYKWSSKNVELTFRKPARMWSANDHPLPTELDSLPGLAQRISWAQVDTTLVVPALQVRPDYNLKWQEVRFPSSLKSLLFEQRDPLGDDHGSTGTLQYPTEPHFQPGIADVKHLAVWDSGEGLAVELEFRNLVDPRWHPEYGFQLTFVALGISVNSDSGRREVGQGAGVNWHEGFRAERTIYCAGPLLVVDGQGRKLAAFRPKKASEALGHAGTRKIAFHIPARLLPANYQWARYQVAIGLQDDHGGAGLGEFREVGLTAGHWRGGGANSADGRVYDWLVSP